MITLNLTPINEEQERIKEYLEENAGELLADKINNGVRIQKDGKTLINKKDLNGFWKYATEQARKISEKGSNGAYVNDDTVFGWAIHYFQEDCIEGTLYNEDGSEYKVQPIKQGKAEYKPVKKPETKPKTQFSLFDFMNEESEKPELPQRHKNSEEIKVDIETGEIITDEHYAINSQIDKEIMIMLYELLDEKLTVA